MKKLAYIISISGICLSFVLQAQAQQPTKKDTTLSRELTLERDYNPNVKDASKINVVPEIKEPEPTKAVIEYSGFTTPFNVKPEIFLLKANSYFTDMNSSKKRGYLSAGVSSFVDIDGDAGYQILNNETDRLSIWGSHRSTNGNVEFLQNEGKRKMKINDNWGGLDFAHDFGTLKLFTGLKYTYSGFNYYGRNINDSYTTNEAFEVSQDVPDQVNNIFDINLGISSQRENEFCYLLSLDYSYFKQNEAEIKNPNPEKVKGIVDNFFKLNWDFHKEFQSDKHIGVAGYYYSNSYSLPKEHKDAFIAYKNYSDLNLNPYLNFDGSNWDLHLGVSVDVLFNQTKSMSFAPDVKFSFRPSEKLALYLNMGGGVNNNNNKNMFYINRYVDPTLRVLDSYTGFDGTLGVKSSVQSNFWFDIFAGYNYIQQDHFFMSSGMDSRIIGFDFENQIRPMYADAGAFKIGANLKYKYQDMFDAGLKATYYAWSVKETDKGNWGYDEITEPKAWNKPVFEVDLNLGFQTPGIPLRFDAGYHLEAGRKAYQIGNGVTDMKNINELNVMGTYSFNETFSVFARAKNLLFQKYDIWYGYPAEGFSAMGGINIKF